MKKANNEFAKTFNAHFTESHDNGCVCDLLGRDLLNMAEDAIKKSKIRGRPKESLNIIKSDMVLESLEIFNRLKLLPRFEIKNPYGYFKNSFNKMLSTILLQRFSSNATKDVFGESIITRGANRRFDRAKFIDINESTKVNQEN